MNEKVPDQNAEIRKVCQEIADLLVKKNIS